MKTHYIVLVFVLLSGALAVDCNATVFEFISQMELGKKEELNITFDKIVKKLPKFPDVVYNTSSTQKYTISNLSYIFRYLDSTQEQELAHNGTVIVVGGKLRIDFNYTWAVTGTSTKSGIGIGYGISDGITFAKHIVPSLDNLVMWSLLGSEKVVFTDPWTNTRVDPFTVDDNITLTSMINKIDNISSLKDLFVQGIASFYESTLNDSLHDDNHKMDKYVNYTWVDPRKGKLDVTFEHRLESMSFPDTGISYFYVTVIKDMADFICGKVPTKPRQTKQFGGTQEFMALQVYRSSVLYALRKGFFNTNLDQETWPSSVFQFYAGDLYDAIPNLTKKFYPSQKLLGSCTAQEKGYDFGVYSPSEFKVLINYTCSIGTAKVAISNISSSVMFVVQGKPQPKYIDFYISDVTATNTYQPSPDFPITNIQLVDWMVKDLLKSSIGTKVFGSNFTTYTRDYPTFEAVRGDNYTIIYDPTHLGSGLVK